MKEFFRKYRITPAFLLFIFLFAYLTSVKNRIQAGHPLDWYLITPEAALSSVPNVILIIFLIGSIFLRFTATAKHTLGYAKTIRLFLLALLGYMVISNVLAYTLSWSFGTISRNFSTNQILTNNLDYLVDFCIYGGFYLAYFLFYRDLNHREKLEKFNQSLAASQIQQLRQQLDPHFLFNNLNILDQLIQEDPQKASAFLLDFSDLFRYLLDHGQKQLVSVQVELDFAMKYFNLIRHKYGEAYQLTCSLSEEISGEIPALSLQLLIENAVQHNLGTEKDPVEITVCVESGLIVRNTFKPKMYKKKTGGRSLQNLRTQFEMLGDKKMEIKQSEDDFEVILPILNVHKH